MKNKYYKKIPLVIRNCIKGIDDKLRQSILILLIENGKTSFYDIAEELRVDLGTLRNQMSILMMYGLVYNSYIENKFDDFYLYYEISKLGDLIISTLKGCIKDAY